MIKFIKAWWRMMLPIVPKDNRRDETIRLGRILKNAKKKSIVRDFRVINQG